MNKILTKNQLILLRLFYTNPAKSFYIQEIGRILNRKPGIFQRTLNQLADQGLLESEYRANARFFRANTHHPFYSELKSIVLKTSGIDISLRSLVNRFKDIKTAILYGSFAKGKERADSDVDLLIVGKAEAEDQLLKTLPKLEESFQREINYKLYSEKEFRQKLKQNDPFLREILKDQHTVLKGKIYAA